MQKKDNNNFFVVSEKRKRIWQTQLDLFQKLYSVCQKHGLSLFASDGTLLGAIRHQGYIPWDDDMDFVLFRKDYQKLCEVAKEEFEEPYFFQTTYTDNLFRVHAQLRNSRTTALIHGDYATHFNHGIFIDIFILDGIPLESDRKREEVDKIRALKTILNHIHVTKIGSPQLWKRVVGNCLLPFNHLYVKALGGKEKLLSNLEKYLTKECDINFCEYVGNVTFDDVNVKPLKKEWFDTTIMMPFENLLMPCPRGYDDILKTIYGDYMTPQRAPTAHGETFFDLENGYQKYDGLSLKEFNKLFENINY